ncbi:MAG: small conductance mechanosensitive channel [Candidatus Woesearchaeota archaeon]|jgi:small conductance mechanosensitive channel
MISTTSILTFITSPFGQVVIVTLLFFLTHFLAKLVNSNMRHRLGKANRILNITKTQDVIIRHVTTAMIYFIGAGIAIYIIPSLRAISVSLFAGAGVLAVIVGFASQQAVSNIISGVFIAIFTPFRVDDLIQMDKDILGRVEDITLRHTVIRTFENKRVVIPNSVMNNEIITNFNIEDEKICQFIEFGISYDSDIDLAEKIMRDEAQNHPLMIDVRTPDEKLHNTEKIRVSVLGLDDSSVKLRAWVWADTPINAYHLLWDLNKSIKQRFDKEGVEIPFPYRTIVYKKNLPKNKKIKKKK